MSTRAKHIITKSSQHFFWGTLLSRIMGLGRDMMTAYFFGSSAALAALMISFRFSNLFRRIFGDGALHAAFVPAFEKKRLESENKAAALFTDISIISAVGLFAITLLIVFSLKGVIAFGHLNAANTEILSLTLIILPSLFFICHAAFCSSLLQCRNRFFLPAISPVVFNLFWMFGLLVSHNLPIHKAVYRLAVWIFLGLFMQWMMMLPATIRYLQYNLKDCVWRGLSALKSSIKTVGKPLSLGLLGVSTTQINNALDALFARFASLEGPAYLWYSIRLQQVPLALFGIAMAGAILAPLSRAYLKNKEQYQELLDYSLSRALGLLIPCTFALIYIGPAAINLLYSRGKFSELSATHTTYCLWAYVLGLISQGLSLVLAPALYAQDEYKITTMATIGAMVLNITLNSYFAFGLNLGAWSIALATTISSWVQMFYLLIALYKKTPSLKLTSFKNSWWKVLIVSFVSVWIMARICIHVGLHISTKDLLIFPRLLSEQVFNFCSQTITYLVILFGLSWIFRVKEVLALLNYLPIKKSFFIK